MIRKSRPILLKATILRLTSAVMFSRVQHQAEVSGWIPASSFAYQKQLSPQLLAIGCRWMLARWSREHTVYVVDWDESNSLCNVPTDGLRALLSPHPFVDCRAWLCDFYWALRVYVVTPFGLVGPYSMCMAAHKGIAWALEPSR